MHPNNRRRQTMNDRINSNDCKPLLFSLFAETPLHPGTGQSTGIIDLPVHRECHTGFPIIPGTSFKGCLREVAEKKWVKEVRSIEVLFGPKAEPGKDLHAGALTFSDARLLAFPVRSLTQVFVWVTCPLIISRLKRDLRLAGKTADNLIVPDREVNKATVVEEHGLGRMVVLEDLSIETNPDSTWGNIVGDLAESFMPNGDAHTVYKEKFQRHLLLLSDDDFSYLVRHATQVAARTALNEKKTTTGNGGNLWYEETLPSDCLFYLLVRTEKPRVSDTEMEDANAVCAKLMELVREQPFFLQVGGNETVGHGWCALREVHWSEREEGE
jgi:CRISPR-associated protein Cmr4